MMVHAFDYTGEYGSSVTTLEKGEKLTCALVVAYLGATTKYVSVRPHTLRIFPGPSLSALPLLTCDTCGAGLSSFLRSPQGYRIPEQCLAATQGKLLLCPSNVGLGVGLMKSGQAERSLSGFRRANSAACLCTQAAMGCVSWTLTAFQPGHGRGKRELVS